MKAGLTFPGVLLGDCRDTIGERRVTGCATWLWSLRFTGLLEKGIGGKWCMWMLELQDRIQRTSDHGWE